MGDADSARSPGTGAGSSANGTEQALWRFCLRVYAAPGVADACLRLQDETGADIPLLLAALWSAVEGPGVLDADALSVLDTEVAGWRANVIHPLRQARRWMKTASHADHPLRDRIKADELAAERHELMEIARWLEALPAGSLAREGAGAALASHLAWLGIDASAEWRVRLWPLVEAVGAARSPTPRRAP